MAKERSLARQEEGGAIAPLTPAQAAFMVQKNELEELLSTPFVQSRYVAQENIGLTIYRAAERMAEPLEGSSSDGPIPQYTYLCVLEDPAEWEDNAGEIHLIPSGEKVLVALNANNVRQVVHDNINRLLREYGKVEGMTLEFVPLSNKAKLKGWSRATTWTVKSRAK